VYRFWHDVLSIGQWENTRTIMEFRLLGPIELWSAGEQFNLGPTRERGVLAILLLSPRTVVPAQVLIDRLWDTRPPAKARESLSAYVTRLRRRLQHAQVDRGCLVARAQGYFFDVDPEAIDLHRFRRLCRQAGALAESGDLEHAASLLREADALWHGQALAGLPGDFAMRMRRSLEEERRAALLQRIELELAVGRNEGQVGELGELLAEYPLDEGVVAAQMKALYQCGRPADALALYRDTRIRLIDELGTEPGSMLSEVHQRILRRDPQLAALADRGLGQASQPDTLPPDIDNFVGREAEIRLLTSGLNGTSRVAVIRGMPGVGKTALAIQTARSVREAYPNGLIYLCFHSHDPAHSPLDEAGALHRLLQMLAIPAGRIPAGMGKRAALWHAQLARRRAVVVLDDVANADQIRAIVPGASECLILITSRRGLSALGNACMVTLDVLPPPDAITLFSRVAGLERASDPDQVAEAVRLCGRLPLAIRLAASRLAQGDPPTLAGLVDELSYLPSSPSAVGLAGHEVVSALDLSYGGLTQDQRRVFRRLGVHPCALISPHAAAAISGLPLPATQAALSALLDHHLLTRATASQFRFHDLIRGYAAACARREDTQPERREAVARLLDYYLQTADRADRMLYPHRRRMEVPVTNRPADSPALETPEDAVRWLDLEWRSVLQAGQHAVEHEWKRQCADLIHVLAGFLETRAYWDEAIAAHSMALQASRDLDDPARIARAALELSVVSQQTGRQEATLQLAEEAAKIYNSRGDSRGRAEAVDRIGMAHYYSARFREALAHFHDATELYRACGDRHGVAVTLDHTGITCGYLGRYADAIGHLREALELYRDIGDRRGEAKVLNNTGNVQENLGYHRDALQNYRLALEIFQEIGGRWNRAILHSNMGGIHRYKGNYSEALIDYRKALAIYRDIGDLRHHAGALHDIGCAYQCLEMYGEALVHHQKALSIAEQIGDSYVRVIALNGIADAHRGSGRHEEALDRYSAALRLAREIGEPLEEAKILEGIAEIRLRTRGTGAARIALRQALDIFERLGVSEAELVRVRIDVLELTDRDSGPDLASGGWQ
jgi:DNA-binding SARP family transcriptional activator/tetratricopeptide (TPR) repeat protein